MQTLPSVPATERVESMLTPYNTAMPAAEKIESVSQFARNCTLAMLQPSRDQRLDRRQTCHQCLQQAEHY